MSGLFGRLQCLVGIHDWCVTSYLPGDGVIRFDLLRWECWRCRKILTFGRG